MNYLNLRNDPVTTPQISNCISSVISMGEYSPLELAGNSLGAPDLWRLRVLMVNSPFNTANTISPTDGS